MAAAGVGTQRCGLWVVLFWGFFRGGGLGEGGYFGATA